MMYVKRILESVKLKVKLPMILEMDNKGALDLVNTLSLGGRTRPIETRQYCLSYIRELKAKGSLIVRWRAGVDTSNDMFTNNLPKPDFKRHVPAYVLEDE
jgi:hypothetical protein